MRIGILGAGDMGQTHARIFAGLPGVEIAGIVGRNTERASRVAGELGVPAVSDPWTLLDDETVDAVDVTYPSALHREWVVPALERGKHVFCETPMALTIEDADAMIDSAHRHDRILMPAQVQRFGVEAAYIHEQVTSGALGRPISAYAASRSAPYGAGSKRPIELYGEPMLDLLIHPFDTLNWLLGTPRRVSGVGQAGPSGAIDYAFVTLDFGEASGMVEGSAMMPRNFPFSISLRVLCEQGALESWVRLGPEEDFGLIRYGESGEPESIELEGGDPYSRECAYFVDCVRGKADPAVVSPEGERDAIRVALAARETILQGKPQLLAD